MSRFLALTVAGLGLLGLLLAWPDPSPAPRTETSADLHPQADWLRENRALNERVLHLERQLERLAERVADLAPVATATQRTSDARPIEAATTEAPLVGVPALSQALELEDDDDTWEKAIADYLTGELGDPRWSESSLLEIDCRTSLCRVQIEHGDSDEAGAFIAGLALSGLDVGQYTAEQDTSGARPISTLVLVRHGSALPTQR